MENESKYGTPGATRTPARGLGIRSGLFCPMLDYYTMCYFVAKMAFHLSTNYHKDLPKVAK